MATQAAPTTVRPVGQLSPELKPVAKANTSARYVQQAWIDKPKLTTDIVKRVMAITKSGKREVIVNEMIDKDKAEDLLTLNKRNRQMRAASVERYFKDMVTDNWDYTGDMVKITWDGDIVNGQHTLWAILLSDTKQMMHIQTGLDPKCFKNLDIGRLRNGGDALSVMDIENPNVVAAAIKSVIYFLKGGGRMGGRVSQKMVSNQMVADWAENKTNVKLMERCVKEATEFHYTKPFLATSTYAFLYYLAAKVDPDKAKQFFTHLASGENLSRDNRNNPIFYLRDRYDKLADEKNDPIKKKSMELRIHFFIYAWNAYFLGKRVEGLKIDTKATEFPKIVGFRY